MNKLFFTAILAIAILSTDAFTQSKTFLQNIEGNWEGTLEYLNYSDNKRVVVKTLLFIEPSTDGNSAEITTIYDSFTRIIKFTESVKIDLAAKKYRVGKEEYEIDSLENGKLILLGSGLDAGKIEARRTTIAFDGNSLSFLQETRSPFQFRNVLSVKRTNINVLAKRTLSPAQLKQDFDVFKKSLTTLHPAIYRYISPENLEKEFVNLEVKMNQPLTESEVFLTLSEFTNKLKCGHTYANLTNQNGLFRERNFNSKTYLPFYFRLVNSKIILTENASSNPLSKGSEITKINGLTVKEIIEKLLTVTKGDGNSTLEHRVKSLELGRFEAERLAPFDIYFPLFFPLKSENYTIEAKDFASQKAVTFQVSAMSKDDRSDEMEKRYGVSATYDDLWKFEIKDNLVGYLKIGTSITWRLRTIKFKEFLANAFAELRAKNIKNLVIDVRGNIGGDMDPGFETSRYLAQKTLAPYAESRKLVRNVAAQTELFQYLNTSGDESKMLLQEGFATNTFSKFDSQYFEIIGKESYPAVEPYANNFQGKTFVISDSSNASATFQFLDYVKSNKLATIVGQTSGGNLQGINGGSFYYLRLPNSQVEIDIPIYFQSPMKAQKDVSVIPDVSVKQNVSDIGNNFDREFEAVKKLIRK